MEKGLLKKVFAGKEFSFLHERRFSVCIMALSVIILLCSSISSQISPSFQLSSTGKDISSTLSYADYSGVSDCPENGEAFSELEEKSELETEFISIFTTADINHCRSFLFVHFNDPELLVKSGFLQVRKSILLKI